YRVEKLVRESNAKCASVALGSPEGYDIADKAIAVAVSAGTWVLLKNVPLAASWLNQLGKRLHGLNPHPQFRLFLTVEVNPGVPSNVLRISRVLMFEPPPGIKANLQESLNGLSLARVKQPPNERSRLYFLLCWLHATLQERLRYVPLGWTKAYEYDSSDLDLALALVDQLLETVAQGRANVNPESIPWRAIRTLLSQSVYGGKIDHEFDLKILETFVGHLFTPRSYDVDFSLLAGSNLIIPDAVRIDQFKEWVSALPALQPTSWLGLPQNAERFLLETKGTGQDFACLFLHVPFAASDSVYRRGSASSSKRHRPARKTQADLRRRRFTSGRLKS
ncbi:MAG: dynein heavy chain domain-containing protein, partial [Olpidium bornovanus]